MHDHLICLVPFKNGMGCQYSVWLNLTVLQRCDLISATGISINEDNEVKMENDVLRLPSRPCLDEDH